MQAAGFSGTVVIRYPVSDDALPVPGASFQAVADRGSTGGVANGATVAQWVPIVDADGVGTATGGTLGLWVASDPAFNGRPVVQFTAATIRAMEWATLSGYTDGEIFWVGVIDEVGSTDGPYVLRVRNSSNSIALLIYNAGATTRAAAYVPAQSNKTVTSLLGTPAVAGFSWVASAGVNYYHNGVAVGSAYAGTMGNLRQKINFTGGTAASGGGGFRVAEIVAFKFKLSPTQRAAMQAYFAAKYGIA